MHVLAGRGLRDFCAEYYCCKHISFASSPAHCYFGVHVGVPLLESSTAVKSGLRHFSTQCDL